ncbi:MAG: hypothetical protein K2M64_04375 [Clostridia bacterium]|nr:hypothetical protein [Clostridia bacterium]
MNKKIICLLMCATTALILVFGLCSCDKSYKYDWTELDKHMNEYGIDYPGEYAFGSYASIYGKAIVIADNIDDDARTIVLMVKGQNREYCLLMKTEYYSIIENQTVTVNCNWYLPYPYNSLSESQYANTCICGGIISNNKTWTSTDDFTSSLKQVSVLMSDLKIDNEGQFESCNYEYTKVNSSNGYLDRPVLDKPYYEYLNTLLSTGLKATTEYFNKNNLPLFYGFAEGITGWEISQELKTTDPSLNYSQI